MNSAIQTSRPQPVSRVGRPNVHVEGTVADTLRAIAPHVDQLVKCFRAGTQYTRPFDISRQIMDVQTAAASARVALEQRFPELKTQTEQHPALHNHFTSAQARKSLRAEPLRAEPFLTMHRHLRALEERIREGYKQQESIVAVRNELVDPKSVHCKLTLNVLRAFVDSRSGYLDLRRSPSLGIRSDRSEVTLFNMAS
jgi:hypothetical protein